MRGVGHLIFCIVLFATLCIAQQTCPPAPAVKQIPPAENMFSDAQEADLGDILAERIAADITVIDDASLNFHLRAVGTRLTQYLPPNQFRFQFFLVELPEANAFSLPGGRVYVSRKIVAFAQSDDELAGVLAHELGHIVTHQAAIKMTVLFRKVLGVTKVTGREDIEQNYQRLLDTWRLARVSGLPTEEQDQYGADNVAVTTMVKAGFSPKAFVSLFDRLGQTHGKQGNWFTDLLQETHPNQRRLREILKDISSLPSGCNSVSRSSGDEEFRSWQSLVVSYNTGSYSKFLPGLVSQVSLALPLRPDITRLRFSPDGNYVLAQDDGGIHVLSRTPLAQLFFIPAPDAREASFTPDSKFVVIYTPSLRVESWSIAERKQAWVHELVIPDSCFQTILSPNGKAFACLETDFTLALFDVASGGELLTKKNFVSRELGVEVLMMAAFHPTETAPILVNWAFSPDVQYFLAGTPRNSVAFSLVEKREIHLPGSLQQLIWDSFAFVGPDLVVGVNIFSPNKSPVLRFPSGQRVGEISLAASIRLEPVTHGNAVLAGPLEKHPLGVLDLPTHKITAGFYQSAGDLYDNDVLYEEKDGSVAIADIAVRKQVGAVRLPQSVLGGVQAIAVSNDFQRLAISTKSRGAVWNLPHNIRLAYTLGFREAWFAPGDTLYAGYTDPESHKNHVVQVSALGQTSMLYPVEDDGFALGPYFAELKPDHADNAEKGWSADVSDIRTRKTEWSRHFPAGLPYFYWDVRNGRVLMLFPVRTKAAQEELKRLSRSKPEPPAGDYLLECVNLANDASVTDFLINTNKQSFRVENILADGDWALLEISGERVLVYSISSGEKKTEIFGSDAVLSAASKVLAVTTAENKVILYDLSDSSLREELSFPAAVVYKKFSPDGRQLFVLTRDESSYILDVPPAPEQIENQPAGERKAAGFHGVSE